MNTTPIYAKHSSRQTQAQRWLFAALLAVTLGILALPAHAGPRPVIPTPPVELAGPKDGHAG